MNIIFYRFLPSFFSPFSSFSCKVSHKGKLIYNSIFLGRIFNRYAYVLQLLQVLAFSAALESRKITTSVRQTRGLDAGAACGQLRNEFQKTPLLNDPVIQEPEDVALAC